MYGTCGRLWYTKNQTTENSPLVQDCLQLLHNISKGDQWTMHTRFRREIARSNTSLISLSKTSVPRLFTSLFMSRWKISETRFSIQSTSSRLRNVLGQRVGFVVGVGRGLRRRIRDGMCCGLFVNRGGSFWGLGGYGSFELRVASGGQNEGAAKLTARVLVLLLGRPTRTCPRSLNSIKCPNSFHKGLDYIK